MGVFKGTQVGILDLHPGLPLELNPELKAYDTWSGQEVAAPKFAIAASPHTSTALHFMNLEGHLLSLQNVREVKTLTGLQGRKVLGDFTKAVKAANLKPLFNYSLGTGMYSGSDPEVFVVDAEDAVIPAWEFLPKGMPYNGNVQAYWDGFQAEFSHAPRSCLQEMGNQLRYGLQRILEAARAHNPKSKLTLRNVMPINHALLQAAKPEHVALGCAPSQNAYGRHGMQIQDTRNLEVRFAGGHMHFSPNFSRNQEIRDWQIAEAVKMLDALVGVAGVSLAACVDDPIRRQWYGLAGEYRSPKHGLEYRTLSNFWLSAPCIYHLIFDMARWAVRLGIQGLRFATGTKEDQVQDIINGCDVKAARKYIDSHKDMYQSVLGCTYGNANTAATQGYQALLNGIEYALKDPFDIEGNWGLTNGRWQNMCQRRGHEWNTASSILAKGAKV